MARTATKTANVNFRVEPELRKRFSELCDGAGISPTRVFTMFMERVVRDGAIPLEHLTEGAGQSGIRYALVRIEDGAGA